LDPRYLSGDALWGDKFQQPEIEAWFADEADAYPALGEGANEFRYTQWAKRYGYNWLPKRQWSRVLGFGSARGGELLPVADAGAITIIESTVYDPVDGLRATYMPAQSSGDIAADDATFDLVVCFGVLHHIPNVSHVVRELGRVLAPGGWMLIREPIVSMGNWNNPRPGLTPHERGIPPRLLEQALKEAGLRVTNKAFVGFPLTRLLWRYVDDPYTRPFWTLLDHTLCSATRWNWRYHPTSRWHRIRPAAIALAAEKSSP
jgi:SAM-dependent methyltransferase